MEHEKKRRREVRDKKGGGENGSAERCCLNERLRDNEKFRRLNRGIEFCSPPKKFKKCCKV